MAGRIKKVAEQIAGHFKPWEIAHFKGMARLGLNELRGLFYAESNIKEVDAGVFGRATPAEISSVRSPELMGHSEDRERVNLLERKQAELRQQVQPEVSRALEK